MAGEWYHCVRCHKSHFADVPFVTDEDGLRHCVKGGEMTVPSKEQIEAAAGMTPLDRRLQASATCTVCKWSGRVGEVKGGWTCPQCGAPVWCAEWDHPTHGTQQ